MIELLFELQNVYQNRRYENWNQRVRELFTDQRNHKVSLSELVNFIKIYVDLRLINLAWKTQIYDKDHFFSNLVEYNCIYQSHCIRTAKLRRRITFKEFSQELLNYMVKISTRSIYILEILITRMSYGMCCLRWSLRTTDLCCERSAESFSLRFNCHRQGFARSNLWNIFVPLIKRTQKILIGIRFSFNSQAPVTPEVARRGLSPLTTLEKKYYP